MIHYPSNLQPESSEMMTHMETMYGSENENPDLFPIQVSIGIHSGEVYLGSTKMRGTERGQMDLHRLRSGHYHGSVALHGANRKRSMGASKKS